MCGRNRPIRPLRTSSQRAEAKSADGKYPSFGASLAKIVVPRKGLGLPAPETSILLDF
jgi:hypothetical protein